jgi:hypothetical protein
MDPYVATIVKECAVIVGTFVVAGLLAAFVYGLVRYSKLQYAMTLDLLPPQLS